MQNQLRAVVCQRFVPLKTPNVNFSVPQGKKSKVVPVLN
jgi:hypothetical protein